MAGSGWMIAVIVCVPIIAFAAGWFLHDSIFPENEWWKGGD